jgi:hypothetical protein
LLSVALCKTSANCVLQGESESPTGERRVDALAAELAAEARRRTEADAIVEELMQYNTAVIEQAQVRAARELVAEFWRPVAACDYCQQVSTMSVLVGAVLHNAVCGQQSRCSHFCLLQEQNEALLAQLHARERTIRELMQGTGASAADVAAFVSNIDARQAEQAWPGVRCISAVTSRFCISHISHTWSKPPYVRLPWCSVKTCS